MTIALPPLGSDGCTPLDLTKLPALSVGFHWERPNWGGLLVPLDHVVVRPDRRDVAAMSPLVDQSGWHVATGRHRADREQRTRWMKRFDRSVHYIDAWICRYAFAIAAEGRTKTESQLLLHRNRLV